jgi:transposase
MSKLTREQRIEIYVKWKDGESKSSTSEQYNVNNSRIEYMVCLVDYYGLDILRKNKNNYYSLALKKDSLLCNTGINPY